MVLCTNSWLDFQVRDLPPQLLYELGLKETWEKIISFIDQLKEKSELKIRSPDYVHDDLDWSNIFYDDKADTITFIDVASLSNSIQAVKVYSSIDDILLFNAVSEFKKAFIYLLAIKNYVTEEEFFKLGQSYAQTYICEINQSESILDDRLLTIFSRVTTLLSLMSTFNHAILKGEIEKSKGIQIQLKKMIIYLDQERHRFSLI